jgi:hypothetical protein
MKTMENVEHAGQRHPSTGIPTYSGVTEYKYSGYGVSTCSVVWYVRASYIIIVDSYKYRE